MLASSRRRSRGQAEYLRAPYADTGPIKVPDTLADDQALFLSDIFPTGCMAAAFCDMCCIKAVLQP